MKYNLFLDDIRSPKDVLSYKSLAIYEEHWIVVRNYNQFVDYITRKGIPEAISFDHDLCDFYYSGEETKEKTGHDAVKWLIDYLMDNEIKALPNCLFHSQNPIGNLAMTQTWNDYKRYNRIRS